MSILLTRSQWDNAHFGKGVACGQNVNADAAWTGIGSDLEKAIIRVYKMNLMVDTLST